jgi:predicted phosphodiesterase
VCERRLEEYTRAALEDIEFQKKTHNISKLQINILGDLMQGNHLHGSDSQASCELSDAEQVVEAIRILFYKVILPLSKTGIKVEILAIPGNHDRQSADRPVTKASKRYLTWIIYNSLKMMCKEALLINVNWNISEKEYSSFEMFGKHFIVVHGHTSGMKGTVDSMEKQLLKRSNQLGIIASGIRIGHFHAGFVSNNGRHIIGTSPVSDDDYGDHLGFVSYPGMMINYYVKTNKRDTTYYKTFEVNLSGIK